MTLTRPTKAALLTGLGLALLVGLAMGRIAFEHEPPDAYPGADWQIVLTAFSWFVVVFLPFAVAASAIEVVVRVLRRRRDGGS